MNMKKIRAHHLLCMRYFEGKGYSEDFVRNMVQVIASAGQCVVTDEADVLCRACPNLQDGRCATQEKVERYDRRAAEFLHVTVGECHDLQNLANINPTAEQLRNICGDCAWAAICQKKAAQ